LLSFWTFKLFLDTLEEATKKTKGHVNMVAHLIIFDTFNLSLWDEDNEKQTNKERKSCIIKSWN
jgi:hypothetical protein